MPASSATSLIRTASIPRAAIARRAAAFSWPRRAVWFLGRAIRWEHRPNPGSTFRIRSAT